MHKNGTGKREDIFGKLLSSLEGMSFGGDEKIEERLKETLGKIEDTGRSAQLQDIQSACFFLIGSLSRLPAESIANVNRTLGGIVEDEDAQLNFAQTISCLTGLADLIAKTLVRKASTEAGYPEQDDDQGEYEADA